MRAAMRIVIAKPGLDGHDRGAKVVARALRDGGHEVIYTGLRRTPEQIVRTVLDEDADLLGLSSLSGAHAFLFPRVCQLLIEADCQEVTVFGGGIIPMDERSELFDVGMRAIFGPGTKMEEMTDFVSEVENRIHSGDPVGVGEGGDWVWQNGA
ncbi:MAG: methylmalonyl-CoA mutase [Euryarchaeota archaeon]|nr:methylmalonyl-CoA mutase [Euryarchaeota archaeon]